MNLFAKIFIGFWLSTAAIIASWLLAGQYFTPFEDELPGAQPMPSESFLRRGGEPRPGPPRDMGPGPRSIYRIFYGLQTVPLEELKNWIDHREQEDSVDIRLVDSEGREIFGRDLLPGSEAPTP